MKTHVIVIDGIARVGHSYPVRVRHAGKEYRFAALAKAGLIDPALWGTPAESNPDWGEFEPLYPTLESIVARFGSERRAKIGGFRYIVDAEIPTEREPFLKDAWEDDGSKIAVNMTKAKAAFERQVSDRKRSVPDTAAAQTPQDLRALWPRDLPKP